MFAATPAIVDAGGNPLPNSIATMETVDLNGTEQWVTIRGNDVNNPVLLFLAGGPGGSELPSTRPHLSALEEHFVVVNWDQPGAGKSYGAADFDTLTPERYVADGLALVQHLRARFDEYKIYVLGESWGTILGTWKELIWFEKSGHPPLFTEADKLVDIMVNRVLPQTYPTAQPASPLPNTTGPPPREERTGIISITEYSR